MAVAWARSFAFSPINPAELPDDFIVPFPDIEEGVPWSSPRAALDRLARVATRGRPASSHYDVIAASVAVWSRPCCRLPMRASILGLVAT